MSEKKQRYTYEDCEVCVMFSQTGKDLKSCQFKTTLTVDEPLGPKNTQLVGFTLIPLIKKVFGIKKVTKIVHTNIHLKDQPRIEGDCAVCATFEILPHIVKPPRDGRTYDISMTVAPITESKDVPAEEKYATTMQPSAKETK